MTVRKFHHLLDDISIWQRQQIPPPPTVVQSRLPKSLSTIVRRMTPQESGIRLAYWAVGLYILLRISIPSLLAIWPHVYQEYRHSSRSLRRIRTPLLLYLNGGIAVKYGSAYSLQKLIPISYKKQTLTRATTAASVEFSSPCAQHKGSWSLSYRITTLSIGMSAVRQSLIIWVGEVISPIYRPLRVRRKLYCLYLLRSSVAIPHMLRIRYIVYG